MVLSPVHAGRWGVDAVHRALLGELAGRSAHHWPAGTPVLCRQNQPELGLANGDVGVAVERAGEETRFYFELRLDGINPSTAVLPRPA